VSRFACLVVPRFVVAALVRSEPELRGVPLVVCDTAHADTSLRAVLIGVSPEAERLDVRPGMTVTQALARHADLVVRRLDLEAVRAAHAALIDVATSVSPRVEAAAPPGTSVFRARVVPGLVASQATAVAPVSRTNSASFAVSRAARNTSIPSAVHLRASAALSPAPAPTMTTRSAAGICNSVPSQKDRHLIAQKEFSPPFPAPPARQKTAPIPARRHAPCRPGIISVSRDLSSNKKIIG